MPPPDPPLVSVPETALAFVGAADAPAAWAPAPVEGVVAAAAGAADELDSEPGLGEEGGSLDTGALSPVVVGEVELAVEFAASAVPAALGEAPEPAASPRSVPVDPASPLAGACTTVESAAAARATSAGLTATK